MKKYILLISIILFTFFISISNVSARQVNLYFFHGDGCPHCAEEEEYLNSINDENVNIVEYEIWNNDKNSAFLDKVAKKLDYKVNGVPVTIVGETAIGGYNDTIKHKIERALNYYTDDNNEYVDVVNEIKEGTYQKEEKKENEFNKKEKKSDENLTISVPGFGKVNLKNVSLASSAVIIGLVDGFNPCAMWVLLFLISILIGMKDRRKMWAIGISFLLTSAVLYFLILMSWLSIVSKASTINWIRTLIAVLAVCGGIYNIYKFFTSKDSGCDVVDDKKRKNIFDKIKKFILACIGACALAVSVNIVELACSAGLPLVFGQLLALNNVKGIQGVLYTLLYVLFFMLDDLIIFIIAMFTTKIAAISTKYNKYSHLIGGIIMLIIGLLLIFNKSALMFNFK